MKQSTLCLVLFPWVLACSSTREPRYQGVAFGDVPDETGQDEWRGNWSSTEEGQDDRTGVEDQQAWEENWEQSGRADRLLQDQLDEARGVNRITVYAGSQSFGGDPGEDWFGLEVEDQDVYGIEWLISRGETPGLGWGLELGWIGGDSEEPFSGVGSDESAFDAKSEVSVTEYYLGGRYSWPLYEKNEVFLGGGLSWATLKRETDGAPIFPPVGPAIENHSDSSLGVYLHAGVTHRVTRHFNIGIDARQLLGTDIDTGGQSADEDVDYFQLAITIGYTF